MDGRRLADSRLGLGGLDLWLGFGRHDLTYTIMKGWQLTEDTENVCAGLCWVYIAGSGLYTGLYLPNPRERGID